MEAPILELKPQTFYPTVGIRAAKRAEGDTSTTADPRVLTFTFATEMLALDDGVLVANGMDASRFLTNPTFFAEHCTWNDTKLGSVTAIRRTPEGWEGDFIFAPPDVSEFADEVYRFLAWAGHGACSVGFIPTKVRRGGELTAEEIAKYGSKLRWVADAWQLLEISIVGVGADPGAILKKGGAPARSIRAALAYTALDLWKRSNVATETTNDATAIVAQTADTQTTAEPRDGGEGDAPCSIDTGDEPTPEPDHIAMHGETMAVLNSVADSMRQLCSKLDQAIESKSVAKSASADTKRKSFDWAALEKFPGALTK